MDRDRLRSVKPRTEVDGMFRIATTADRVYMLLLPEKIPANKSRLEIQETAAAIRAKYAREYPQRRLVAEFPEYHTSGLRDSALAAGFDEVVPSKRYRQHGAG